MVQNDHRPHFLKCSAEMFQVWFAICVNLLHPCTLMVYYYLFDVFLS